MALEYIFGTALDLVLSLSSSSYTRFFFPSAIRRGRPTKYSYLTRSSKTFKTQYDPISDLFLEDPFQQQRLFFPTLLPHRNELNPCQATSFLYSSIQWARSLPLFSTLSLFDQVALFKHSWSELFLICAGRNDFNFCEHAPFTETEEACGDTDTKHDVMNLFKNFQTQIPKLKALDDAEYEYLRGIILFCSGKKGTVWIHSFFYKNSVFFAEAEYS